MMGMTVHEEPEVVLGPLSEDSTDENECTLPCGSEGSIAYNVWENTDPEALLSRTVLLQGDLKDYGEDDVPRFMQWLSETVAKLTFKGYGVCGAVCSVATDTHYYSALWDTDTKRFVYRTERQPLRYEVIG
jgi:hypothetical protein